MDILNLFPVILLFLGVPLYSEPTFSVRTFNTNDSSRGDTTPTGESSQPNDSTQGDTILTGKSSQEVSVTELLAEYIVRGYKKLSVNCDVCKVSFQACGNNIIKCYDFQLFI